MASHRRASRTVTNGGRDARARRGSRRSAVAVTSSAGEEDAEDAFALTSGSRRKFGPSSEDAKSVRDALLKRSLEQAGWDEAKAFLAARASTALGRAACETLEPSETASEAQRLLNETEAAMVMESKHGVSLDFGGMLTAEVRRGFYKTRQGSPLGGDELAATAAFLESAKRLKSSIEGITESGELPRDLEPLRRIAYEMMTHSDLAERIRAAVEDTGEFRDNASQDLRRARSQKGAAEGKLKKAMQGKGTPTTHQGRMVLAVPAPAPPDVLVVGTMAGGSMVLIEPPGVVALNRELARAIEQEKSAVDAIKRELSNAISEVVEELMECLEIVIRLDVIAAKCRYSQALNGVRPQFTNLVEEDDEEDEGIERKPSDSTTLFLELIGLRQPVLASQAVQAAAERRQAAAEEAEKGLTDGVNASGYKVATMGSIKAAASKANNHYDEYDFDDGFDDDDEDSDQPKLKGPVPVDIFASRRTRVVVITGPNTGGKTAAMKAVGLSALMAKSGIFIPAEKAVLPFFDKILVDIGDDQSLLTSLSTFSGRLTRAQAILEQCTTQSLVLMDEVGTGTSPAEGAAIGYALLKALAGLVPGHSGAAMTFATTHHGQLKALKYEHEEFENAAVEFDEADLRPTYKLLWGVPGRSSALQIASRFNLDADVVEDARSILGEGLVSLDDTISKLETARRDADADIVTAIEMLDQLDRIIPQVEDAMESIRAARDTAAYTQANAVMSMLRENKMRISEVARLEKKQNAPAPSQISAAASGETDREREVRIAREKEEQLKAEQEALKSNWVPFAGEEVKVVSTGMSGKVISVDGNVVTLQAGIMQVKANLDDVAQPYIASKTPPKMQLKKPRGASQAARRADDLLAASARVTSSKSKPSNANTRSSYELSESDMDATVGDIVVVKKTGFKGKVIDDDDGLLTIQAGPQRVLAPVQTVEIAGGKSPKTVSKKKGKKKSFGLPNATKDSPQNAAEDAGKADASASSLEALRAKFGKK